MAKYYCRYSKNTYGKGDCDNLVVAETAQSAALEFWKQNKRNHPLPVKVDIFSMEYTYQITLELALEVVVKPVLCCGFPVDNPRFPVDKPVEKMFINTPVIHT